MGEGCIAEQSSKCLRNARKAKKAAEAAEEALTSDKGLVNTVNTLSLALSRMEEKLQTVDTTVQTINTKQLAMDVKLNTLISNQANMEIGMCFQYGNPIFGNPMECS